MFDEHEAATSLEIMKYQKILDISMWSNETRVQKGKKLKRFISDNFNIEKIKEKTYLYSSLEDNQKTEKNNNYLILFSKYFLTSFFKYINFVFI